MIHYRGCCANQIQPTRQFLSCHHYHLVQSRSGDERKWLIQEVHESQQKLLLPHEGVVCHRLASRGWHICPAAAPELEKRRMQVHWPLINLLSSFWEWAAAAIILSQEPVVKSSAAVVCECRNMLAQPLYSALGRLRAWWDQWKDGASTRQSSTILSTVPVMMYS